MGAGFESPEAYHFKEAKMIVDNYATYRRELIDDLYPSKDHPIEVLAFISAQLLLLKDMKFPKDISKEWTKPWGFYKVRER